MQKFKTVFLLCGLVGLSACAIGTTQIAGSTPGMVSVCAGKESQQMILSKAQAACQEYGKNAELIEETKIRCFREGGWMEPANSYLQNFRCVAP